MFNLFVSIKPNNQKFTLLIEKVTFKKNNIKYESFQQNLDLTSHFKKKSNIHKAKNIYFLFIKTNEMAQGWGRPKAGYLPLLHNIPL